MIRKYTLAAVMILMPSVTVLAETDPGTPPRPKVVARECVQLINVVTQRATTAVDIRAKHCVAAINALLQDGADRRAHGLAQRCATGIGESARRFNERISAIAERCLALLRELEAPQELMDAVRRAAHAASDRMQAHVDRALHAIREALQG